MTLTKTFYAATVAIALGTITGLLSAASAAGGPIEGAWWSAPVIAGITAFATLIKITFGVDGSED